MKFTSTIFASACLLALASDRVSAEKMKIGQDRLRRELKPGGKGKGKGSCSSLSTGAFCSIAERVATGSSECRDFPGNLDIDLCPTQYDVCDPSFTVASFCEDISGSACSADCELAVSGCCELNCCEDTCFDEEEVCELFELFTCPDINFEICPCADDERSFQEYCEALVGPFDDKSKGRCFRACARYVQGCCELPSAFRRAVWINELHYNEDGTSQSGNDDNEYVEIAFTNSIDLQGYQLWAFNGQVEGGRQPSNLPYEIVTLSSSPQVDPVTGVNFLQVPFDVLEDGGGPVGDAFHDAVALVDPDGNVVEFISYGADANIARGTAVITRMINGVSATSIPLSGTAMGVTETGEGPESTDSLQRQGTGCAAEDFVWLPPKLPTPGTINAGQTFDCAL